MSLRKDLIEGRAIITEHGVVYKKGNSKTFWNRMLKIRDFDKEDKVINNITKPLIKAKTPSGKEVYSIDPKYAKIKFT
jgi:hypothetical protein